MNKRIIKFLVIMFFSFMVDSIFKYYLPQDLLKTSLTLIPYMSLMMFMLLNNLIDEENRYPFALICGSYYCLIYGNSVLIYMLLFVVYAFFGHLYMKKSKFTYLEALVIVSLTIIAQECVIYWLMWITNMTRLHIATFMLYRLLPTVGLNIILFNAVYFIHKKFNFEGGNYVYFGKRS